MELFLYYEIVDHDTDVTIPCTISGFKSMDEIYNHLFQIGRFHSQNDGYKNVEIKNVIISE